MDGCTSKLGVALFTLHLDFRFRIIVTEIFILLLRTNDENL